MNTYGQTNCPECNSENSMFRPIDVCQIMPAWDITHCYECGTLYKHTEQYQEAV